jgi:hypothetical protein
MTNITTPTAIPAMAPGFRPELRLLGFVGGGGGVGGVGGDGGAEAVVVKSPKGTLIINAIDDA